MSSTMKDIESGESAAGTKQRLIDQNVKIAFVVGFYFVSSMLLVFLNKRMFSAVGKEFPLFVTWWQFVVALVLIHVGSEVAKVYPSLKFFAPLEFKTNVAIAVAPVTGVFIGMVVFNNLCLKYVEVSFYQTARSLTIVFSVVLTWFVLGTKTSLNAMACCGVVMAGFVIGSAGEINFSLIGWLFGIASSFFVALYGIYVKRALNHLNGDSDVLLVYNTILSIIMLLPLIFVTEIGVMIESPSLRSLSTWFELTLAGVAGLLINVATFLQIQHTSALTHNISGTAKAAVQSLLGLIIYANPIGVWGIVGLVLVLGGSALYTYIRKLEQDAKAAESSGTKT